MGYWEQTSCKYCGGHIAEKWVDLYRKVEGKPVLIENIPAGVCTSCGARFYTSNVLASLEEMIRGHRQEVREVLMPVFSLLHPHQVLLEEDLHHTKRMIDIKHERS